MNPSPRLQILPVEAAVAASVGTVLLLGALAFAAPAPVPQADLRRVDDRYALAQRTVGPVAVFRGA